MPSSFLEKTKTFEGSDARSATARAKRWIDDPEHHGPLRITSQVAEQKGARWVVTIKYYERRSGPRPKNGHPPSAP